MTKKWIKAAGVRMLKTMAQAAVAILPTSAVMLHEIDWLFILSSAVLAGVASVLTSIAGLPEIKEESEE